jgi:hypothetical protein
MQALGNVLLVVTIAGMLTPGRAALAATTAPDFIGGGSWFNTGGQELHLAALKGKVVAVDLWTAGCYNNPRCAKVAQGDRTDWVFTG